MSGVHPSSSCPYEATSRRRRPSAARPEDEPARASGRPPPSARASCLSAGDPGAESPDHPDHEADQEQRPRAAAGRRVYVLRRRRPRNDGDDDRAQEQRREPSATFRYRPPPPRTSAGSLFRPSTSSSLPLLPSAPEDHHEDADHAGEQEQDRQGQDDSDRVEHAHHTSTHPRRRSTPRPLRFGKDAVKQPPSFRGPRSTVRGTSKPSRSRRVLSASW